MDLNATENIGGIKMSVHIAEAQTCVQLLGTEVS